MLNLFRKIANWFKNPQKTEREVTEMYDHIIDCVGKEIADIHIFNYGTYHPTIIYFTDGTCLKIEDNIESRGFAYLKRNWRLEDAKTI